MKKPNIIFYFSDQQRWDTCGCYGQELDVTPNLDKLAKEGTLFQNAFTCQPVCGPARACLQTGKFATEVGCFVNGIELPLDEKPLAQYFNENGYETAYVGKWHLASNNKKDLHYEVTAIPEEYRGGYKDYWMAADVLEFTSHGYDGFVFDKDCKKHEFIGYRADCINNYAVNYVQNQNQEKPFFMFVSQIEPHHQNDRNIFEGPDGSKEKFKDYKAPGDLVGTGGDWKENYPDYLGQCHSLDYNVGRLIDTLKAKGIWDNTIIFYTSDHGSHFCTRNAEYKRSCHDGCIHLPMIAHGGAFTTGKAVDELVSLIDIPTTLLDCAGIKKPEGYQGNSLKKLVNGEIDNWTKDVFLQISESHIGRAVRTKDWKYSVRALENPHTISCSDTYYEDFLYDLNKDPHERNNLICDENYADIRKEMAEILKRRMAQANEAPITILPNQG